MGRELSFCFPLTPTSQWRRGAEGWPGWIRVPHGGCCSLGRGTAAGCCPLHAEQVLRVGLLLLEEVGSSLPPFTSESEPKSRKKRGQEQDQTFPNLPPSISFLQSLPLLLFAPVTLGNPAKPVPQRGLGSSDFLCLIFSSVW